MPTIAPAYNDVISQIRQINKTFHILHRSAVDGGLFTTAGNNYTDQESAIITGMNTINGQDLLSALRGGREALNLLVLAHRSTLVPLVRELGRAIASDSDNLDFILADFYDYCITNAKTFKTPDITFDDTATITGTGNGTLLRYHYDDFGYADYRGLVPKSGKSLSFKCITDKFSGVLEGREAFRVFGDTQLIDELSRGELGIYNVATTIQPRGSDNSDNLLTNGGFEGDVTINPAAVDGDEVLDGWFRVGAVGDLTKLSVETDTTKVRNGDQALKIVASTGGAIRVEQEVVIPVSLAYSVPFWKSMFGKRDAAGAGTFTIYWGNKSRAFTVASAFSDTVWTQFTQELTGANAKNLWLRNFRPASGLVKVGFSIDVTAGTVWLDTGYFGRGDAINNSSYLLSPGVRDTGAWVENDLITFEDTTSGANLLADGIMYYWFNRHFNAHLPTSGTPSANEVDPTFT